jgi:tRNA isopentenyl-2-thiomethyl-A-37 hydroxylase MiaE
VAKIFEGRAKFVDKTVEIVGDEMPARVYAQIMSRVLKRKITYNHIPRERYASMGLARSCELADMFEFLRLHPKPTCSHHAPPTDFCRDADV